MSCVRWAPVSESWVAPSSTREHTGESKSMQATGKPISISLTHGHKQVEDGALGLGVGSMKDWLRRAGRCSQPAGAVVILVSGQVRSGRSMVATSRKEAGTWQTAYRSCWGRGRRYGVLLGIRCFVVPTAVPGRLV